MAVVRLLAAIALVCVSACAVAGALPDTPAPATVHADAVDPIALDFLAGEWRISDPSGAIVGRSTIELQQAGAMLFERRAIGQGAPQLLWFANLERAGWAQLFLAPTGELREFVTSSENDVWPMIMGGEFTLRDGTPARFRMTLSRASDDETRRVLEMSRDEGQTWSIVFDYTYRRIG